MSKNNICIPIIYEDEHVLALNKPAGISVHGNGKTKEYTVADWILENYPNLTSVGEPQGGEEDIPRPGIVHRLDKETSGVLMVAKDQPTYLFLKNNLRDAPSRKHIARLRMACLEKRGNY